MTRKTVVIGARIDSEIKEFLDQLAIVDLGDLIRYTIESYLLSMNGHIDLSKLRKEIERKNVEDKIELEKLKSLKEYYLNEIKKIELQMHKIQERIEKRNNCCKNIESLAELYKLKKNRIMKDIEKLHLVCKIQDPGNSSEWLSKIDVVYPYIENLARKRGVSVLFVFRIIEDMYNVKLLGGVDGKRS